MKPDRHTDVMQMADLARALCPGQTALFRSSTGDLNALQRGLERNVRAPRLYLLSYVFRPGIKSHLVLMQRAPLQTDRLTMLESELPPIDHDLRKDPHWGTLFPEGAK